MSCKPCGENPCNQPWCSFTELYDVTCGCCGRVSIVTWKDAVENGPICCPTEDYEIAESSVNLVEEE